MGKGIMGSKDRRKKKKKVGARKKKMHVDKYDLKELAEEFKIAYPEEILDVMLVSLERMMQQDSKLRDITQQFLRDSMNDISPRTPLWVVDKRAAYLIAACLPKMVSSEITMSRAKYWIETDAKEIAEANSEEIESKGGDLIGYHRGSMKTKEVIDAETGETIKVEKTAKKDKGQGIGDAIMSKLKTSPKLSYEDALELAKQINPNTKFSKASFNWYKNKVKKEG